MVGTEHFSCPFEIDFVTEVQIFSVWKRFLEFWTYKRNHSYEANRLYSSFQMKKEISFPQGTWIERLLAETRVTVTLEFEGGTKMSLTLGIPIGKMKMIRMGWDESFDKLKMY
jgi:hypothetical protein